MHPRVRLRDLCTYEKGRFPTQATPEGPYTFIVTAEEQKTADDFQFDAEAVCIPLISSTGHGHASMKRIHYVNGQFALANLMFALFAKDSIKINMKFLYYFLSARLEELFVPLMKGAANVSMRMEDAVNVEVPLPPIEEQIRFADEISRLETAVTEAQGRLDLKAAEIEQFWET